MIRFLRRLAAFFAIPAPVPARVRARPSQK